MKVSAFVIGIQNSEEFYALDVPAARSDRIHLVDGKLLTWYGPRMASSLSQLSAVLEDLASLAAEPVVPARRP